MDKLVKLGLVERLKNSDFTLEKQIKVKIQNNQIHQLMCERFILP